MAMGVDVETDEARLKEEEEANAKAQEEEERVKQQDAGTKKKEEGKRENFFAKFFNLSVGSKFYEGELCIMFVFFVKHQLLSCN